MRELHRLMILLAAFALVAGCAPSGIVNSGRLVRLDPREVCIEEPDGNEKCFALNEESVVPAEVKVGDIVSVRVVEGTVKEVEVEEVDGA